MSRENHADPCLHVIRICDWVVSLRITKSWTERRLQLLALCRCHRYRGSNLTWVATQSEDISLQHALRTSRPRRAASWPNSSLSNVPNRVSSLQSSSRVVRARRGPHDAGPNVSSFGSLYGADRVRWSPFADGGSASRSTRPSFSSCCRLRGVSHGSTTTKGFNIVHKSCFSIAISNLVILHLQPLSTLKFSPPL